MPALLDPVAVETGEKALLVIMPGAYDSPQDLVHRGFVRAVRERGIAADVILPDAHLGYFRQRSFEERLRADVIAPARSRGYKEVWLAGISLGGFGSLLYASRNPGEVDGLITLAPFIADEATVAEVVLAGGLKRWQAPERLDPDDFGRRLLAWLKGYAEPASTRPRLLLAYGASDRFATINRTVGELLPAGDVLVAPGGHTWAPWLTLWGQALDRAALPRLISLAKASD
jgi:pimeloyl-ACP methyl ester carboxylesterase